MKERMTIVTNVIRFVVFAKKLFSLKDFFPSSEYETKKIIQFGLSLKEKDTFLRTFARVFERIETFLCSWII